MKKIVLAFALVLLASPAMATIVGSAHDFTGHSGIAETRICVFCHTPHFATGENDLNDPEKYYPLWNRDDSPLPYAMYDSRTMTDKVDRQQMDAPGGPSKLCMSCHDGSIAIDTYGSFSGNVYIDDAEWSNKKSNIYSDLGADGSTATSLTNDHPISFSYVKAYEADGELRPLEYQVNASLTIKDLLYDGERLECSSCHDVHNKFKINKLLVVDDSNKSALCLTCHVK